MLSQIGSSPNYIRAHPPIVKHRLRVDARLDEDGARLVADAILISSQVGGTVRSIGRIDKGSFEFDVGRPDCLAPFLIFQFNEAGEFLRGADRRFGEIWCEALHETRARRQYAGFLH